jgi:hypothetical protein
MSGELIDSGGDAPRDAWHPRIARLYEYWQAIHPPDGLPGRQHFDPTDTRDLLPDLSLLEVQREPFRVRYRLAGTNIVRAIKREVTGHWLDDVQEARAIPGYFDRFRAVVETKAPSWRRGPPHFQLDAIFASLEDVFLPLARDGQTVDMILTGTIFFRIGKTEF